jgi:hypothetical protein
VQAVGVNVVVRYAKQNATKTGADDDCGEQCSFVDVFTSSGRLLQCLKDDQEFKAPWGVAMKPRDLEFFSHDPLIGSAKREAIHADRVLDEAFSRFGIARPLLAAIRAMESAPYLGPVCTSLAPLT